MALPITVPFTFGNATTTQSLSSLDADFSTVYNAVNGIGNGTVSLSNVSITGGTIANAAITGSISYPDQGYQRNRIINGDMRIDQRNAGGNSVAINTYTVDRWGYQATQSNKGTWGQNFAAATPPVGFASYLGFQTAGSGFSVGAGDYFGFYQPIEGFNTADFAWGTANAKTVTLSFQVLSSLTGTFGGVLQNSNSTRCYPFTYTISNANTWTQISVTIVGETTGTWLTTNGVGVRVIFNLGCGSTYSGTAGAWSSNNYVSATGAVSVVGTASATFYITGVQLEVGTVATPFERRQYGQELLLCQRYYQYSTQYFGFFWSGNTTSAASYYAPVRFAVPMRTAPTVAFANYNVSGFPASVSTGAGTAIDGFRADATANGTGNGNYFSASWTASAEL